ncbi:MAG TPA: tRNA 2-thiouridine(34) synthase MnmA [Oscillospiraceae bacterium]|nr:tRNA 2-thiouridine(34) synthase MnmA [Oscillospiraceae bacterium]
MSRAVIAMSGGVDSTVAAHLIIQKGFDCIGATMRLLGESKTDCLSNEYNDARTAAARLGIAHDIINFSDDFERKVIGNFIDSYERGETPNPCIECNRYMKFGALLEYTKALSYDYLVTGHYAKIKNEGGRYYLMKAADPEKDQSYFLYFLTQKQLKHIMLPLGELSKNEVRKIAKAEGFTNAKKKESQDICFVPNGDYAKFIETVSGKAYPHGNFMDKNGSILGKHKGLIRYTIGQRKGLGLALPKPLYVCEKKAAENAVILGENEDLYKKTLRVKNLNFIPFDNPPKVFEAKVKVRYRQKEQPAFISIENDGTAKVEFLQAQRAITPGQTAVFYDGDMVLGGGVILPN